jgi:alkylation response protein AidB-like acyl-CoA dehydrogenase
MRHVEIVDTWYCAGLQGTSSDSARVAGLFVPEHRMVYLEKTFGSDLDSRRHVGEPGDYWPVIPLIRSAGLGLVLGAAEAALELALETAKKKGVANTTYARQSDSPVVQRNLGAAAAKIHAASLLVADVTGGLDQWALRSAQPDMMARARNKSECSLAIELLTDAANTIMNCAGSSAFMLDNSLQRFWRDINVAARHAIYNPDAGYEIFGRAQLGVEPNIAPPPMI